MGSDKPAFLAGDLLAGKASLAQKRRALAALAESPDEASASALVDAARDAQLQELSEALLEGYPDSVMVPFVARRLRTETDKNAISVLQSLDARLARSGSGAGARLGPPSLGEPGHYRRGRALVLRVGRVFLGRQRLREARRPYEESRKRDRARRAPVQQRGRA